MTLSSKPLSSRRGQSYRRKFIALDKNLDHKLSFDEVKEALRSRCMGAGIEELKSRFRAADKNEDGFLNQHEFVALMLSKEEEQQKSCEDERSTEASSDGDTDEKEERIQDGEDFDHWMTRVEDCRRWSAVLVKESTQGSLGERCSELRRIEERRKSLPSVLPPLADRPSSARSSSRPATRRASDPTHAAALIGRRQSLNRGPERFFYDHSTYTGVQAHCVPVPPKPRNFDEQSFRRRRTSVLGLCKHTVEDYVHDTNS